jgi:CRISPR/Cas system CSM-associated protein Csm3 (group 7 of RAMP superfamily)
MRNLEEYKEAGRSNPLDPQQLEEHPYDFVTLPTEVAKVLAPGHDRLLDDHLHGVLHLTYRSETPLHVGSGSLDTSQDYTFSERAFSGRATPLRGLVRRQGKPVLPGASWKGVVRSRFEAFTRSSLCLVNTKAKEETWKLPEVLRKECGATGGKVQVKIQDSKVCNLRAPQGGKPNLNELSPADALFGCMGYRGRVRPTEGEIEGEPAKDLLRVPPLEGPQMHRLAKPGKIAARHDRGVYGHGKQSLHISQVEGRKFYYDGPVRSENQQGLQKPRGWEPIDQVPAGSTIRLAVHFSNLDHAELGALLLAAGHGEGVGIVRFGGFKSAGLGKVRLVKAEVLTHGARLAVRRWRLPPAESLDLEALVAAAHGAPWFDKEALHQLDQITRRCRPEAGGGR